MKKNSLLVIIILLFLIPFFWLKPGEVDLGGDNSRLYFYDPLNYLRNLNLYTISPEGTGPEISYQFSLPFVFLLWCLKKVLLSPYLLITFFNSLSLVVAFLAMYGITAELLKSNHPKKQQLVPPVAIFVGLFYLFLPLSIRSGWDKALLDHLQIFLYPLIFYLFLRYLHSEKIHYLLLALLVTFIFSPSFSYTSAPKFFAFFSLAVVYLGLYSSLIKKKRLKIKPLFLLLILFIALHAFHLFPQLSNLFEPGSHIYFKVFTKEAKRDAVNFLMSIAAYVRVSRNLLGLGALNPSVFGLDFLFLIFPAMMIIAASFNKNLNYLLLFIFFLIAFFFATARITNLGLSFYRFLLTLPGLSMFRSYLGQWARVFIFFYSLLVGQALFSLLPRLKGHQRLAFFLFLTLLILVNGWPLIRGEMINPVLTKSAGVEVRVKTRVDPLFEETLNYIRELPVDGKLLTLPLTDYFYQILAGQEGGAYIGPSIIGFLSGKNDFTGYQIMKPFSDLFLRLAKEKDYESINVLLGLLNIKYIFYNSDPYILENFLDFPYQYTRQYLPVDQKSYQHFVEQLAVSKTIDFGEKYHLYSLQEDYYLPHLYVASDKVFLEGMTNFFKPESSQKRRTVFLGRSEAAKVSDLADLTVPKITFRKINPTKYLIRITGVEGPYLLVFSEMFNLDWQLFLSEEREGNEIVARYFNGEVNEGRHQNIFLNRATFQTWNRKPIANERHLLVNGYANAWYLQPSDVGARTDYTLVLEMISQRLFYLSLLISLLGLGTCVLALIAVRFRND